MPKSVKSLGPSDQLIHATVKVSEGAATPVKSTDQVQVPQRHEEHEVDGAGRVSKQSGPKQVDKEGANNLIYLCAGSSSLYPLSCIMASDLVDLNGMGPLHVWDHTKKALNVRHPIRSRPV